MGQIVFNGQKPKYANKLAITTGTMANEVLDENEIWLIDSTVDTTLANNTKSSTGTGKYDKYIVGDGHTAAKNLQIRSIDNADNIPTLLSQLGDDETHRLVTDEDIRNWNNAAAGEGGTLIESSEDITVVNVAEQNINKLEFANKQYSSSTHSGLGKVYVKKNIQTVPVYTTTKIFDSLDGDIIITDLVNAAVRPVLNDINAKKGTEEEYTLEQQVELLNAAAIPAYNSAYAQIASAGGVSWGKRAAIDGRIHGSGDNRYINITPNTSPWSVSHCYLDVQAGEFYKITAQKSDVAAGTEWISRFWILTEIPTEGSNRANVIDAYKADNQNLLNAITQEVSFVKVTQNGRLWINYISYNVGQCTIEKISETGETAEINVLPALTEANTEYIIQYDYDLNGGFLEMPANSVLRFEGGSIKNGYIKGNNSTIIASSDAAVLAGSELVGKWKNTEFYPKWFGAAADGVTDDTEVLQKMLNISTNIGKQVKLMWYGYSFKTTHSLYLKSNTKIYGGSITAQFEDPLSWIFQTFSIYESSISIRFYISTNKETGVQSLAAVKERWGRQVGHRYIASWQEFDGKVDALNHVTDTSIEGLSLTGKLNKHYTTLDESLYQGPVPSDFSSMTGYERGQYWTVETAGTYCGKECSVGDIIYCCITYHDENEDAIEKSEQYRNKSFTISPAESTTIWDGSYCPIFGGLKLNGCSSTVSNVRINNVGIGMARGACLHSYDTHLSISAKFIAYAAHAVNTTVVTNCYLNAWCNYYDAYNVSSYIPYHIEYQGVVMQPNLGSGWESTRQYIEGTGGIDDGQNTTNGLIKPKLCSVKTNYASITFIGSITDSGAEVGFASTNSTLVLEHPYLEGVHKCYIYAALTRVSVNMAEITSSGIEYDFIINQCSLVLNNCAGRIGGTGGSDGANHKYISGSSTDLIQIVGPRVTSSPNDNKFKYLSLGDDGLLISSVSGSTLTALVGKYYKFTESVNDLAITLPVMTNLTSAKAICIDFTVGDAPNITFTSADSKPISYYGNYGYDYINSEYEISCLFNGTKWIIANTVID